MRLVVSIVEYSLLVDIFWAGEQGLARHSPVGYRATPAAAMIFVVKANVRPTLW